MSDEKSYGLTQVYDCFFPELHDLKMPSLVTRVSSKIIILYVAGCSSELGRGLFVMPTLLLVIFLPQTIS